MSYRRILVAVDGSAPSRRALAEAIELARDGGASARLRLLHVVDPRFVALSAEAGHAAAQLMDTLAEVGAELLADARRQAEEHGVAAEVSLVEAAGGVADAIVTAAQDWPADLIVVGTHGRRGLPRLVLGSDAEQVARRAPAPLLLVRPRADAPAG